MNGLAVFIATFGYVGYFPIAPGTAGSLAALALYALVRWAGTPAVSSSPSSRSWRLASGPPPALSARLPGKIRGLW